MKRVGLGQLAAAAARQRARPDQGAARRAHARSTSRWPTLTVDTDGTQPGRGRWPRSAEALPHDAPSAWPAPSPYDVVVGRGVLGPAPRRCSATACTGWRSCTPPADSPVGPGRPRRLRGAATSSVPDGEAAKTAAVVADCWERLGEAGFTRSDAVVTRRRRRDHRRRRLRRGDLAARRARGARARRRCSAWSTRRSAARPASTPPPARTWSAPSTSRPACCATSTCSRRCRRTSWSAGSARSSSAASSPTPRSSRLVEADPAAVLDPASDGAARAGRAGDPGQGRRRRRRPQGDRRRDGHPGREVLNYGHTLGARDRAGRRTTRSGTARRSSIGMVYVAELARLAGRLDDETAARHAAVLARVGLPTSYVGGAPFDDLLAAMRVDKKTRGAQLRFVVLDGLARPAVLERPAEELLRAAYDAIGAPGGSDEGPGAQRSQPRPARPPAAGDLRHHHPRRARRAVRGVGRELGLDVEVQPDQPRGRAARLAQRRRRRRRRRWCSTPRRGRTTPTPSSTPAPS